MDKKFIIQLSIFCLISVVGIAASNLIPNVYEAIIAACETIVAAVLLVWWWTQS